MKAGWLTGWGFVAVMAGLGGVGVYMGRFLRWNSWDLLIQPFSLVKDMAEHFIQAQHYPIAIIFPVLFSIFIFGSYTMLYALTFLEPGKASATLCEMGEAR